MSNLTKREQYLIVGALLLSIIILTAYLYYFPLRDEINQLEAHSNEISRQIEEAKETTVLIEKTNVEIEQLEQELAESREFLMDAIDEPEILSSIGNNVLADGEITIIRYYPVEDNEIFFHKDVEINFTTSYSGLKNILTIFEEDDKFTTIPDIMIYKPEEEIAEDYDEDGQVIPTTNTVSNDIEVNLTARFYGSESTWDGSGEYDFMDGNTGRINLFY